MKTTSEMRDVTGRMRNGRFNWRVLLALGFLLQLSTVIVSAFPPALPHTIYGMARDEYGNPLRTNAIIVFTTSDGTSVTTQVDTSLEPGVNYRLVVPLDSGVKRDTYKSGAVQASVSFRIRVTINNVTSLPLEMTGNYSTLGQPGKQTRIDLTLGEDTNGNGLPDAWERAMLAARGWTNNLADLKANSSPGGNGITLLQEYVAGTYGFEDDTGLNLNLVRVSQGVPVLEFLVVPGRNYSIVGTADLKAWTPVAFRPQLPVVASDADPVTAYLASEVRLLQVTVPTPATGPTPLFYKLQIR